MPKTSKPKLSKKQIEAKRVRDAKARQTIEKRRYSIVFNATGGNTALARQARGWRDSRIQQTYGAIVPKRGRPELREFTTEQRKRKEQQIARIGYAQTVGIQTAYIDPAVVKRYKSKKRIKKVAESDMEYDRILFSKSTKRERFEIWQKWGKDKALPTIIESMARAINRDANQDIKGHHKGARVSVVSDYGFVIAFHMFVEGQSREDAEYTFKPDPWDAYRVSGASGGMVKRNR